MDHVVLARRSLTPSSPSHALLVVPAAAQPLSPQASTLPADTTLLTPAWRVSGVIKPSRQLPVYGRLGSHDVIRPGTDHPGGKRPPDVSGRLLLDSLKPARPTTTA